MRAVSISSSADRRRELLIERHDELQAQLALVEEMLNQAKPSTMLSMMSGVTAASKKSSKSVASHASRRSDRSGSGVMSLADPGAAHLLETVAEESGSAFRATKPSQVPLMLDPNDPSYETMTPFRSGAGTGLALPGTKLSAVA